MPSEQFFKKILVPTDGSTPSLIAQELAAFIAKKFHSKVTVFHVVAHEFMNLNMPDDFVPTTVYAPAGPLGGTTSPILEKVSTPPATALSEKVARKVADWYHQKGAEAIADAEAVFKEEGIRVDKKIVEHVDPAEAIIKQAQEGNYDLIVMGQSGEEEQEPHLGSVAKKVSLHAKTPMLIVKEKKRISKILVPFDGSKNAEKALQYAVFLAKKADAKMTLLYVQEPTLLRLRPKLAKEIGTRILSKATKQVKGIKLNQKIEFGDPAKMTIQMAKNRGYNLIVIGSKGHGAIERFLLGSVSDHVIHYTNRSVLLVK